MTLQAFGHAASPPLTVNVTGPETLSVRRVAEQIGQLLHRPVHCVGKEAPDALLSDASLAYRLFGRPRVSASRMIRWIADWCGRGGVTLNKATHFEVRNGRF